MKEARYYKKIGDKLTCYACPHLCSIKENQRGKCRVRKNVKGKLYSMVYGKPNALHLDPIEKKPLFHFLPGKKALSIGTAGCNQSCKFCQNWRMSQCNEEAIESMDISPEEVVEEAKRRDIDIIAYTYNEPTVYIEYMQDIAKIAKEEGIKNVAVTCGLINEKPLRDTCKFLDAANIDLKYFSNNLYRKISGGYLNPVLNTIKTMKEEGVWIEITNLVIPGLNDSNKMIKEMCRWIVKNVGRDVPIHFSRFHPDYEMLGKPPTPIDKLKKAEKIAREQGIKYVYIGNIPGEKLNTKCNGCGELLIDRTVPSMRTKKLDPKKGKCKNCGRKILGVWSKND
ncbi:MAG: AmmeMemoRadiSam system radical SAM enzyme [archaeon]